MVRDVSLRASAGKANVPGTVPTPVTRRFTVRNSGAIPRGFDTEVKLLEDIASRLAPKSTGVVSLYTEKEPCTRSCQSVIKQFEGAFPGVKVQVTWGNK